VFPIVQLPVAYHYLKLAIAFDQYSGVRNSCHSLTHHFVSTSSAVIPLWILSGPYVPILAGFLVNKRYLPMLLLSIVGDDIVVPYAAILGLISSVPKQSSQYVRGFIGVQ
jgi:hypothetical protein